MAYTHAGFGGLTSDLSQDALDQGLKMADSVLGPHVPAKAKKAYALAFAMARAQATQALSHPTAQKAFAAADEVLKVGDAGFRFATNISSGKYNLDASGVASFSKDLQSTLTAFIKFGQAAGLSAGAANAIHDATSIATGCTAGVASGLAAGPTGAIAGGLGCVFRVAQYFSSLFWQSAPVLPPGDPRAVFFVDADRAAQAAIDAMRLAKVLKTYYGISSYSQIEERMMDVPSSAPQCYLFSECSNRGGVSYPARSSGRKTPAVDLHWILMAMQPRHSRWVNIKDALSVIERGRAQAEMAGGASLHPTVFHPNGGRRLWHRYYADNDINVPAIELGAFLARSAIAARGTPISSVHIWGIDRQAYDKFDWEIDFEPFMHVDELLNFFVAVTIQELNDGLNPVAPYDKAFGPMWRTVCETAQDPKRVGGPKACDPGFSETYWTNLLPHKTRKEIVTGVWARNPQALKDFAVIRLVSAWSYMHMLYNWTYALGPGNQQDIVAMTDKASVTDPFFELKAPVDPRQAFVGGDGRWHNRAGDTSGPRGDWGVDFRPGMTWPYVATVRDVRQTKTQAHGFTLAANIAKLSGEIGGAFKRGLAAGTNTAVATLVQQFKQPTSMTLTATAQSSNLMQQAIASGKISMFARPDLLAASQAQAASQQQALQQPQAGGSSLLPIAAIAGLALLLMR